MALDLQLNAVGESQLPKISASIKRRSRGNVEEAPAKAGTGIDFDAVLRISRRQSSLQQTSTSEPRLVTSASIRGPTSARPRLRSLSGGLFQDSISHCQALSDVSLSNNNPRCHDRRASWSSFDKDRLHYRHSRARSSCPSGKAKARVSLAVFDDEVLKT